MKITAVNGNPFADSKSNLEENRELFGFMGGIITDGQRALKERGMGLIDLGLDYAPETTASIFGTTPDNLSAAMDSRIEKLRSERDERGFWSSLPGEMMTDPVSVLKIAPGPAGGLSGALMPTKQDESRAVNTAIGTAMGHYGSKLFRGTGRQIEKGIRKMLPVDQKAVDTFQKAGLKPSMADVTPTDGAKRMQAAMMGTPGGGHILGKSAKRLEQDANEYLQDFGINQAKSLQTGGRVTVDGFNSYVKKGKNIKERLYSRVDDYIGDDRLVNVQKLDDFYSSIVNDANLTPSQRKKLSTLPALREIGSLVSESTDGMVPYKAIKTARTTIGELVEDRAIGTSTKSKAGQAYSVLTDLMEDTAADAGDDALRAFQKANGFYSQFRQKVDNEIQPILNRANKQGYELAIQALKTGSKKSGSRTKSLMDSFQGKDREIVRGTILRDLGSDLQKHGGDDFTPFKMAREFLKLDEEAQNAVLTGMNSQKRDKFISAMRALDMARTSVNSVDGSRRMRDLFSAGVAVYGTFDPATALLAVGSAMTGAQAFTNQRFINWLAGAEKGFAQKGADYLARLTPIIGGRRAEEIKSIFAGENPDAIDRVIEQPVFTPVEGNPFQSMPSDKPARINVTPDDTPQGSGSSRIDGGSANDLLQMASLSPYDGNWQPSPRMLSGEVEGGDQALLGEMPLVAQEGQRATGDILDRIMMAESSGNPNAKAKTSSASGLFQFTDGTFRNMVKKYGKEYGFSMKDKNKPEVQRMAAGLLMEENRKALSKTLDRQPTAGELYLAHFAGQSGAKRLLKAQNKNPNIPAIRVSSKDAVAANIPIYYIGRYKNGKFIKERPRTVGEVVELISNKVS